MLPSIAKPTPLPTVGTKVLATRNSAVILNAVSPRFSGRHENPKLMGSLNYCDQKTCDGNADPFNCMSTGDSSELVNCPDTPSATVASAFDMAKSPKGDDAKFRGYCAALVVRKAGRTAEVHDEDDSHVHADRYCPYRSQFRYRDRGYRCRGADVQRAASDGG
jgi:hypothetical protein